jgi:hypothetical protein
MSIVKAEKAIKRITKTIAFLFLNEENAIMNNSHPRFSRKVIIINGLVKKNHLHWNRFGPSDALVRVFWGNRELTMTLLLEVDVR